MIHLEHVVKMYDSTVAVNDLSLDVEAGEMCVLVGPSGCGKTTTLRMVNRLVMPTSGRVVVNGADVRHARPEQLRRSIGYAIQSVGLFPHMTVGANIAVVPELLRWDKMKIAHRIDELLRLVGLEPSQYAGKYPNQLSGGEAQRIGVARALAADPPILLMDEPFGAVDPLTRQRLQTQFLHIQSVLRKTVILVTHDLDEAIRMADRMAIMRAGRLVQHDTPEAILANPAGKFVHDFVGVDRALKRLSRIGVPKFLRAVAPVTVDSSREQILAAMDGRVSVWVVDADGRPTGWIDRDSLSEAAQVRDLAVAGDPAEISVTVDNTLRDALSRMLGLGFRSLPVVDESGRLTGEITLADIEAATTGAEKPDRA